MKGEFSLYIHIPFCISKCAYCDFFSEPLKKTGCIIIPQDYVDALCNEIKYRLEYYGKKSLKKCKSIYIGGGTPSLLEKNQLHQILSSVMENTHLCKDCEITLEVNPDDISEDFLQSISETCINRVSCGIQSLNSLALKKACRRAQVSENLTALEMLCNHSDKKISVDLISGLPEETEESFEEGLKKVISYNPDHISLYSLTIEDETPFGKMLSNDELNYDFDFADKMWLMGREILVQNGYEQYEVSNFCKKNNQCHHNLTYWNHEDYLGCGSGGTGSVYSEDGSGFRWTNTNVISDYIKKWLFQTSVENFEIQEVVDRDVSKFEFFMMGLRKLSGINDWDYIDTFNEEIPWKYIEIFKNWERKSLMDIKLLQKGINYSLNSKGILFLNKLLQELC